MTAAATNGRSVLLVVETPGRQPIRIILTDRLELGRDCDGLLVADPQISRHHVELRLVAGGVVVRDLDSSNGTWLDGLRLHGEQSIDIPSVLKIGSTTVRFANLDDRVSG